MNIESSQIKQLASELAIKSMESIVKKEVELQTKLLKDISKEVIGELSKDKKLRAKLKAIIYRHIKSELDENGLPDSLYNLIFDNIKAIAIKELCLKRK